MSTLMYYVYRNISDMICSFFFFNDTATTEIYTLSLHDALPISGPSCWRYPRRLHSASIRRRSRASPPPAASRDRKSTRLKSSHSQKSYALFFLEKKKKKKTPCTQP